MLPAGSELGKPLMHAHAQTYNYGKDKYDIGTGQGPCTLNIQIFATVDTSPHESFAQALATLRCECLTCMRP